MSLQLLIRWKNVFGLAAAIVSGLPTIACTDASSPKQDAVERLGPTDSDAHVEPVADARNHAAVDAATESATDAALGVGPDAAIESPPSIDGAAPDPHDASPLGADDPRAWECTCDWSEDDDFRDVSFVACAAAGEEPAAARQAQLLCDGTHEPSCNTCGCSSCACVETERPCPEDFVPPVDPATWTSGCETLDPATFVTANQYADCEDNTPWRCARGFHLDFAAEAPCPVCLPDTEATTCARAEACFEPLIDYVSHASGIKRCETDSDCVVMQVAASCGPMLTVALGDQSWDITDVAVSYDQSNCQLCSDELLGDSPAPGSGVLLDPALAECRSGSCELRAVDPGAVDAGARDAGAVDAGAIDAGAVDSAARDAGAAASSR